MQLIKYLCGIFIATVTASKSWGGTNLYFLPGLSESQQDSYLDSLQHAGAKVVRLWVNAQNPGCDKGINVQNTIPDLESTPGTFDATVLDALDGVLVKLASRGMKALISPHDANALHGANGNDGYGQWYGSGDFYSNTEAAQYYDNRLTYILNYQGKTSGQIWKSWTQAIMGFDVQNEPMAPQKSVCTNNDESNWLCGRAQHLRTELGADSPIQIATGGIGGDLSQGCTFMQKAMTCEQIDLVSVHAYKGSQASNPGQWSGSVSGWLTSANGKLLMIEEFGTPQGSSQASDFAAQTADLNSAGVPWTYWQITPPQECDSIGSDVFGVFSDQVDITTALQGAQSTDAKQDWNGIIY